MNPYQRFLERLTADTFFALRYRQQPDQRVAMLTEHGFSAEQALQIAGASAEEVATIFSATGVAPIIIIVVLDQDAQATLQGVPA